MITALRAEWTKLRTVRSTKWTLLAILALTIGLGAFMAAGSSSTGGVGLAGDNDIVRDISPEASSCLVSSLAKTRVVQLLRAGRTDEALRLGEEVAPARTALGDIQGAGHVHLWAALAAWLAYAWPVAWTWFVAVGNYIAVAALFGGEWLYRRWRFPQYVHASPLALARIVIGHWRRAAAH